ncbi:MAG TPA: hypothetical protein VHN20_19545 [Beijerinckiaceae bacterium]|nr:hypothetical protein [Beijerinckiaceae bacterium]
MTQQPRAPDERQGEAAIEQTVLSDADLLVAIRRELLRVYAELLNETVPDRVARVVERLDAETKPGT